MIVKNHHLRLLTAISVACSIFSCSYLPKPTVNKKEGLAFERSWARATVAAEHLGYRHPATISPILFNNLVIDGNAVDRLSAYNRKSGHRAWTLPIERGVEAVALHEGRLYFGGNDGYFYQVDAQTGQVLWKFLLSSQSSSAPLVRGDYIFHMALNGSLYAFEKGSGRVIWVKTRPARVAMSVRGNSRPTFHDGRVYVGHSDGYLAAYDASSGQKVWQKRLSDQKKFNDLDVPPVISKNCVLISNYGDSLYCVDHRNGQIRWSIRSEGSYKAIQVYKGQVLYSTGKQLMLVDEDMGKVKRTLKYPASIGDLTTVIPYKKWFILGSNDGPIFAVDQVSGKQVAQFHSGRGLMAAPVIDEKEQSLYFVSNQANIYKLNLVAQ